MRLYKHESYNEYLSVQIRTYKEKSKNIFVSKKELEIISKIIECNLPNAKFGICHGVRTGFEVAVLRNLLGIEVIGTDIAVEDPSKFIVRWDFHELNPEWVGKADFIYSNSWDHAYDPDRLFHVWNLTLASGGLMFIAWTEFHAGEKVDAADSFHASLEELINLVRAYCYFLICLPIEQWKYPGRSYLYSLARKVIKRKPIKIYLLIARKKDHTPFAF